MKIRNLLLVIPRTWLIQTLQRNVNEEGTCPDITNERTNMYVIILCCLSKQFLTDSFINYPSDIMLATSLILVLSIMRLKIIQLIVIALSPVSNGSLYITLNFSVSIVEIVSSKGN
jgi:hypothetical protein